MEASAADLANYREQVAAIEQALKDDPGNTELVSVRTELLELISLTEALLQQQGGGDASSSETSAMKPDTTSTLAASASPLSTASASVSPISPAHHHTASSPSATTATAKSTAAAAAASRPVFEEFLPQYKQSAANRAWTVGDKCRALYEGDGKFYEATIVGVGASGDLFTVEFKGYESSPPSLVRRQDLKPSHEHYQQKKRKQQEGDNAAATGDDGKAAVGEATTTTAAAASPTTAATTTAPPKKKKSKAAEEAQEQIQKQNAWKNFAAKGKKTGMLAKKSMFATPDNPHGKVGVVGSGKGMTQFQQRGKHVYNADE